MGQDSSSKPMRELAKEHNEMRQKLHAAEMRIHNLRFVFILVVSLLSVAVIALLICKYGAGCYNDLGKVRGCQ